MLIHFFYLLNILFFLIGLFGLRLNSGDRLFSLALIQVLLGLPLLAGEYFYLGYHLDATAVPVVLFSEVIFSLIWFSMARRLRAATAGTGDESRRHFLIEISAGTGVMAGAGYFYSCCHVPRISDAVLIFHMYAPAYFSAVFILLTVLYAAWRLEQFWRALNTARRWEYKFLIVGSYLVCGTLAWGASYRLTYLTLAPRHLLLMAMLLLFGWTLTAYAVVHHRLLNRKIFVSRKVVYSFIVPSLLSAYLLGFGLVSLLMRTFGLQLSFVLKWLFISMGFVATALFAFSAKIRRRVQFFISTHFYINKYEYRDEWLALSEQLQGALTETDVINALRRVLTESLYTTEIFIWTGDPARGYRLVSFPAGTDVDSRYHRMAPDDLLIKYIRSHFHFHLNEKEPDMAWHEVAISRKSFLTRLNLILITPLSIGDQLTGLIGLGPEFTGGQYGPDDYDLLTALGSQTASALLAVRMAEELARTREQQAWNRLSAFVLHDIKNAATMLSMLRENAPDHIHEPEFQTDMLELVDDALKRMGRVEHRLQTLKEEISPERQDIELTGFFNNCRKRLKIHLPAIQISVESSGRIRAHTDPDLLFSAFENLALNALEATGEGTIVRVEIDRDESGRQAVIEISDNGPGIAPDLLPDLLFEPFKTTREGGSGIGLWQVKKMITSLGGSISAANRSDGGGARFTLRLPCASD